MFGRSFWLVAVRWDRGREQTHLLQPEGLRYLFCKAQMCKMDWIECASEKADGRHWNQQSCRTRAHMIRFADVI